MVYLPAYIFNTFEPKTIRKHEDLKYAWYKIESSTFRYKFQNLRSEQFHDLFVVIFSALWKNPILDLQKLNAELK